CGRLRAESMRGRRSGSWGDPLAEVANGVVAGPPVAVIARIVDFLLAEEVAGVCVALEVEGLGEVVGVEPGAVVTGTGDGSVGRVEALRERRVGVVAVDHV